MDRVEVARVTVGVCYRHHELRVIDRDGFKIVEDTDLGKYRVDGFVHDWTTHQELVLLRMVQEDESKMHGTMLVCSLQAFANAFRPLPVPEVPKKVAGVKDTEGDLL